MSHQSDSDEKCYHITSFDLNFFATAVAHQLYSDEKRYHITSLNL